MATATTTDFAALTRVESATSPRAARRRISRQAGRALVILGHAIDHLTEDFVSSGAEFYSGNSQLEAVRLLMACNREVYFDCPEIPSLSKRLCALLVRRAA